MKRMTQYGLQGLQNPGFELEMTESTNTSTAQVSERPPESGSSMSATGKAAAWWASYSCSRWKQRKRKLKGLHVESRYRGLAEDVEGDVEQRDETDTTCQKQNKKLLNHFRQLAATNQDTDQVDLQFLDEVISDGADPNTCDRYGQTILHEISRAWSVDVMRFFLDRGSDLLRPDQFGVTALHVASALDYQDMVKFLLDHKADPEARTLLDQQTPLHYAAKNDAAGSIRLLLQARASISCIDYKHRTPLQLAANMERSEAARVLMELGAEAGVIDSDGQLCITALIGRMSPVALLALSQFHVTDRLTRQEFYYLNLLEPEPHLPRTPMEGGAMREPTSPLEVAVQQGKLDLIMHPVFLKLIEIKWKLYGRLGAWLLLILNILFNVSWTTVAISVSVHRDSPNRYTLPEDWWRVLLVVLALLLTVEEVLREVQDILRSRKKVCLWRQWAEQRLCDELQCSHPMWPQEKVFLSDQNKRIYRMRGNYRQDLWVHDNSKANAVMQQATVILQVEESMPFLRRFYDNQYISKYCAPLAEAYDDDITTNPHYHDEMGRITSQIKKTLDQFLGLQKDKDQVEGKGVMADQNQNKNLHNQDLQDQNLLNKVIQDQNVNNQELQAIREELKQLRTLVQQLVQTRSESG